MKQSYFILGVIVLSISLHKVFADSNMCLKEATVFKLNPNELQEYRCDQYCRCNKNSSAPYHYPGCKRCFCEKRAIHLIKVLEKQIKNQEQIIREKDERNKELQKENYELKRNQSMLASNQLNQGVHVYSIKGTTNIYEVLTYVFGTSLGIAVICILLYCLSMKFGWFDRMKSCFTMFKRSKRISFSYDADIESQIFMQKIQPTSALQSLNFPQYLQLMEQTLQSQSCETSQIKETLKTEETLKPEEFLLTEETLHAEETLKAEESLLTEENLQTEEAPQAENTSQTEKVSLSDEKFSLGETTLENNHNTKETAVGEIESQEKNTYKEPYVKQKLNNKSIPISGNPTQESGNHSKLYLLTDT